MTDARLRQLERQVESEPGDTGSRFALTRETLRRQKGIVAFWHGEEKPHLSACKISIGFEVKEPLGGASARVVARPSLVGWMLAITSPSDLLEVATLRGGCRLLDLETWRAVGLFGEAESVRPEGSLQVQASTVDAWGRTRNTKVNAGIVAGVMETPIAERYGPLALTSNNTTWWLRPKLDEAIYDREYLSVHRGNTATQTSFFQNHSTFQEPGDYTDFSKHYGRDTNCHGQGGGMPAGHGFLAKGISVFVDEGTPKSIVDTIKQESSVRFRLTARDIGQWAGREVMPRETVGLRTGDVGDRDVEADFTGSIPAIRPFSYAFPLTPLEHFAVELYIPQPGRVSDVMRASKIERVGVMVVLHGSRYMGVVG